MASRRFRADIGRRLPNQELLVRFALRVFETAKGERCGSDIPRHLKCNRSMKAMTAGCNCHHGKWEGDASFALTCVTGNQTEAKLKRNNPFGAAASKVSL